MYLSFSTIFANDFCVLSPPSFFSCVSEAEMEYCVSAASKLAEEIWQITEGFVEVLANLYAQFEKCLRNIPNN